MKLRLTAYLLLLVPLAFAEPAPSPFIKLLFDDCYVLTESYDPREIRHYYYQNLFHFFTKSNSSKYFSDSMDIKRDLMKRSGGFAIEAYTHGPNFKWSDDICRKNSSEQLKHLIDDCQGNIILRMLTDEERGQIRQYIKEQKVTRKPFEMIYDRKRTITKSTEISQLNYDDTMISIYHSLGFDAKINSGEKAHVYILDRLTNKSFVIESLPADSKEFCGKVGLDDLDMVSCSGEIKVRPY